MPKGNGGSKTVAED